MPALENAGNVLRTETSLRLSVRVPPHCSAEDAAKELKETLEKVNCISKSHLDFY
jgi:acetylornithine deacetylase/succinyl-diaminopimelate desuccinylase-like protein